MAAGFVVLAVVARAAGDAPARLEKVTWSLGTSVTRVEFRAGRRIEPDVARPSPTIVRIDLAGVSGAEVPSSLPVGSSEIRSITRIEGGPRTFLPAGVSERFLVQLVRADLAWAAEPTPTGFTLHVGPKEQVEGLAPVPVQLEEIADEPAVEEPPAAADLLPEARPFVAPGDLVVRSAPSALASATGAVTEGQTCIADARRGEWLHLAGGGWLRAPDAFDAPRAPVPAPAARATRTAVAWSAGTLTGLTADLVELPRGMDAAADALVALVESPVATLVLAVRVDPTTGFGFKLPPKEGRVTFETADGRTVASLDPRKLPAAHAAARAALDATYAVPKLAPGDAWSCVLLVPADLDLRGVRDAWLDVGGVAQRLVRVPGSGEVVGQSGSGARP